MKLADYQVRAVEWLSTRRRGLVVAPAGSGKTVIGAAALAKVVRAKPRPTKVPIGWVCNTQEQARQATEEIGRHPELSRHAEVAVMCAKGDLDWSAAAVLVVDEAHHSGSLSWSEMIGTCKGAIWGLTATPATEDEARQEELRRIFGEQYVVPRSDVQSDRLVQGEVRMLADSDPGAGEAVAAAISDMVRRWRRFLAPDECRIRATWLALSKYGVQANVRRNKAALQVARDHMSGQVLVLCNVAEHARWFASALGPGCRAVYAAMGKRAREAAMTLYREGDLACMACTSLADEGLDLPMADTLVLVGAGKSRDKAEQRSGRVLRKYADKRQGIIYDFLDRYHPTAERHAEARMAAYADLGYATRHWPSQWERWTGEYPAMEVDKKRRPLAGPAKEGQRV